MIAAFLTVFAASPWMRAALRSGERAGRLAERLETTEKANDVQRRMLEAAARRPRDRDELAERLRDGRFGVTTSQVTGRSSSRFETR